MSVPNGTMALILPLRVATASADAPVAEARRLREAGLAHEKARDLTAPAEACRAASSLAPRFAEAHDPQERDRDGSAAALSEAERLNRKKIDGQAATFAMDLGKGRLGEGDLPGGIASLREEVRLAPDWPKAHVQIALALERQSASAEARPHFDEARRPASCLGTQPRAAGRPSAASPVPHP
jgi:hypothetical protein